jgi:hypothetical protein
MKKPNTDNLELQLLRLEREVSDDFNLICDGGVQYFSTEELRDLWLQWRLRSTFMHRLHYVSVGLGFAALSMLFLGVGIHKSGWVIYADLLFFIITPSLLLLSFGGQIWLHLRCPNRKTMQEYGAILRDELQKRKQQQRNRLFQ